MANRAQTGNTGKPRKGRGAFALPTFTPWKLALTIAATYLAVGIVYIIVSGFLAAQFAASLQHLKHIELIKGIGFIVTTAILLMVFSYVLFRRIAHKERVCGHQREALILSENRALAGVFASSVAHDINNVLTILDYAVDQLAKDKLRNKEQSEHIEELQHTNERLRELTNRLAHAASPQPADVFEQMDLIHTIQETVDLARTHNRVRDCQLNLEADPSITMAGNSVLIHQMLLNLIINAADACNNKGRVQIRVQRENDRCAIEVHDNGTGISEKDRQSIFTPFFSTKHTGKGLGLLSVKSCADAHHGTIEVTDSPLGGACFRITLPMNVGDQLAYRP